LRGYFCSLLELDFGWVRIGILEIKSQLFCCCHCCYQSTQGLAICSSNGDMGGVNVAGLAQCS